MWISLCLIPENFYYSWIGLVAGCVEAAAVYFVSLYLIKGITKDDLKILLNKKL